MQVRLLPLDGGEPVELTKDMSVIGRGEDADLRIDHKSVSKQHCVLVKTDGLVLVRDLGSTNGTRVNGHRVRRGALLPNDQIAVANFRYQLVFGDVLPTASVVNNTDATSGDKLGPKSAATLPVAHRNTLPDEYVDAEE